MKGINVGFGYRLNLGKIDTLPTDGLLGVEDSLSYRVHETERHVHGIERWYGDDADNTMSTDNNLTPWTLAAGTGDAYGAAVQIAGPNDVKAADYDITPVKFDLSEIFVSNNSVNAVFYMLQIWKGTDGFGDSTSELASEIPYYAASGPGVARPSRSQMGRVLVGDKLWARLKCETDAATLTFLLGAHAYQG